MAQIERNEGQEARSTSHEGNASWEGQEGRNASREGSKIGGDVVRTKSLNEVLFESFK